MSDPQLTAALAALAHARQRDPMLQYIQSLLATARREFMLFESLTAIEQETLAWITAAIKTMALQQLLLEQLKASTDDPCHDR